MEPSFDLLQSSSTFLCAFVYGKMPAKQAVLALGFLILAATQGVDATSNACDTSGLTNSTLIDGILGLILAILWGLRTYLLNQSYTYNRAPYWASLRNSAFCPSLAFVVIATVAIILGWCLPTWQATMQNVVAVAIGALAMATAERRPQGPASARLKALQHMLQRPYYRDGRTGGNGYSDDLGRRLFEERDKIPWNGKPFKEGGWDCTLVEFSKPTHFWRYYVKPGPINDHFFMGLYQVLEAAGSGHDPLTFSAAYASVTASYMLRPKLKRVMVRIVTNIVRDSGRVKLSFTSWRPTALAQLLGIGIDQLNLPDVSELDNWPTLIHDTKLIVVLWAICWLEDAWKMEEIMKGIAKYMAEIHVNCRVWKRDAVVDKMVAAARETWIGPQTAVLMNLSNMSGSG